MKQTKKDIVLPEGATLSNYFSFGSGDLPDETGNMPASVALLELLPLPACVLDRAGSVVHLNSAWREYAGLVGTGGYPTWPQLVHADDRYMALSQLSCVTTTGERMDFECRLMGPRGMPRWFLLNIQPFAQQHADDGNWLCVATDVHAMKQRESELARRASMQTDMLNISVDCIKLISLDGTVLHMNKAGCVALGVPEDSSFGMAWVSLLPEDVKDAGDQAIALARAGGFARFSGRSILPGRKTQHWDNMLSPMLGVDGQPTAILCISREVTSEHDALESLRSSQERLAVAAHVGGLGIWDYDIPHDQLHCNDDWYLIMGRDPRTPIRSLTEFRPFLHPDDADRATEVALTAAELLATGEDYAIVYRIVRPNGEIRWLRSAACIQYVDGLPMRATGFVTDITDARRGELALQDANRALEAEKLSLARQNLEDPLTGIANRRYLDSELTRLGKAEPNVGEGLSVGMIDVDHFKAFNDRYGHFEGDAALRLIAGALQSVVRKADFIARYGGEEFAFILTDTGDPASVLDRFIEAVAELRIVHADSPTGYLTVSCGCAAQGSPGRHTPAELLRKGDEALYNAKQAGRNRHVVLLMNG